MAEVADFSSQAVTDHVRLEGAGMTPIRNENFSSCNKPTPSDVMWENDLADFGTEHAAQICWLVD